MLSIYDSALSSRAGLIVVYSVLVLVAHSGSSLQPCSWRTCLGSSFSKEGFSDLLAGNFLLFTASPSGVFLLQRIRASSRNMRYLHYVHPPIYRNFPSVTLN